MCDNEFRRDDFNTDIAAIKYGLMLPISRLLFYELPISINLTGLGIELKLYRGLYPMEATA